MSQKFHSLKISGWRQFDRVEIEFHDRLTVLTGANGAGKSTLLHILTQHFGWSRPLLSTPMRDSEGNIKYLTGVLSAIKSLFFKSTKPSQDNSIGEIQYSDRSTATLAVPEGERVEYSIAISNQKSVLGLFVPSHRIVSRYQQIGSIPTKGVNARAAFSAYQSEILNRYNGSHSNFSPLFKMKEALISMATFGAGNEYVKGLPELLDSYLGFVEVLRKVLPATLGFERLEIRTPEVVVVTNTGEFLIDALSGGLAAVVDLAWQIFTFSVEHSEFVVVIDEPENHLHPSMQREVMPNLVRAFPKVQFVVATHSPFVVTGVRDSYVYVLDYVGRNKSDRAYAPARSVASTRLDQVNKAAPASDVLKSVLGVETTIPVWAALELDEIVREFGREKVSSDSLRRLKDRLAQIGLADSLPSAIETIVKIERA